MKTLFITIYYINYTFEKDTVAIKRVTQAAKHYFIILTNYIGQSEEIDLIMQGICR